MSVLPHTHIIMMRHLQLVNTDPQRRCYNGCHFKSELLWTAWSVLEYVTSPERVEPRLLFWRELNDYAIGARGESARSEFRCVEESLNG
jgi:hypothetical protein